MPRNITDYFPESSLLSAAVASEAGLEPVEGDISGDVVNPQGEEVIDVGNNPISTDKTILDSQWTLDTNTNVLTLTDSELADTLLPGDILTVNVDGVDYELTVDSITGDVITFDGDGSTVYTAITDGDVTMVSAEGDGAVASDFTVNADGTVTYLNPDLAENVKVGDVLVIRTELSDGSIDTVEVDVVDVNTVDGEIILGGDNISFLSTDLGDAQSINVNIKEVLPTFAGVADEAETFRIENLSQAGTDLPTSGPIITTDVVLMTVEQYEAIPVQDRIPSTLYLLVETPIT